MRAAAAWLQPRAVSIALAVIVFWLALKGGTYAITVRNPVAMAAWLAVALGAATAILPRARVPRIAFVAGALLAAFAALNVLSMLWADSNENAFTEFNRASLYVAVFALVVLASARGSAWQWTDGLALGITAVGLFALSSRLFPEWFPDSDLARLTPQNPLLTYPLNYWNGLGVLVVLALPLLLAAAVRARTALTAALAVAPIPALTGTAYLTSSRGGLVAAAIALAVFLALTHRRPLALAAVAAGAAGTAMSIAVLHARQELVNEPVESDLVISQGRSAALLIVVACVLTALAFGVLRRFVPQQISIGSSLKRAGVAVGVVALAAAVVAVDPPGRLDSFKKPPERFTRPAETTAPSGTSPAPPANSGQFGSTYVQSHLLDSTGSGRWQFWEAAVDQFEDRPVLGGGAGSYQAWWAQHGSLYYFVNSAHSLFLEVLGELGLVGLLLLLGFFGAGVWAAAIRVRSSEGDERVVIAALAAALLAFIVPTGVDWLWDLPAVGAVGIALLALLVGPATVFGRPDSEPRPRLGVGPRVAAGVAAACLIVAQAVPLFAELELRDSEDALARGDLDSALSHAEDAESLQGWAASPHLQLALVEEQRDDLDAAADSIQEAIDNDPSDWQLWAVASRIEEKMGLMDDAQESFEQALALNPRSPVLRAAEPDGEGGG